VDDRRRREIAEDGGEGIEPAGRGDQPDDIKLSARTIER
jgi:hypothetical protein